jgi:integrase
VGDLYNHLEAWTGVTWGLVKTFQEWQVQHGYAVGSINVRISTVKTYAALATKAGFIPVDENVLIQDVKGFSQKEKPRIDENRVQDGIPTRIGAKKADWVELEPEVIRRLKNDHPDTPQGRRDRVLMCMFFDQGLRCGELALIEAKDINLRRKTFRFYRPKTSQTETHEMTRDTFDAISAYRDQNDLKAGKLLRRSNKWGALTESGMTPRAITKRVNDLGLRIAGLDNLSAHDARHNWISEAEASGSSLNSMMQAGGWTSPAMVMRYVKRNKIANAGLKLNRREID